MHKGRDGCDQAENTSSCWDKGVGWGRAAHRGDKNWTEAVDDMKRDSCWGNRIDGTFKNSQCWMRGSTWGRGAEAEWPNHPTEDIAKSHNPTTYYFGGGRRKKSKRKSKSHKRKSHKRKSHKRKSHKRKSRRTRRR